MYCHYSEDSTKLELDGLALCLFHCNILYALISKLGSLSCDYRTEKEIQDSSTLTLIFVAWN